MALPDFPLQPACLDSDICLGQLMARDLPQGYPAPSMPESFQHCIDWALCWHSNYRPCSGFRQDLLSKFWLICMAGGPGTDCEKIENLESWLVLERVDWGANCQSWLNNRQRCMQQKIREAGCTAPSAFSPLLKGVSNQAYLFSHVRKTPCTRILEMAIRSWDFLLPHWVRF